MITLSFRNLFFIIRIPFYLLVIDPPDNSGESSESEEELLDDGEAGDGSEKVEDLTMDATLIDSVSLGREFLNLFVSQIITLKS